MSTVKLDLTNKSVPEKIQMGRAVKDALGDPAAAPYTALAAAVKAATDDLEAKNNASTTADAAAEIATGQVNISEGVFNTKYGDMGRQVQTTTNGDPDAIMATSYALRADASPVAELDYVENFSVTTTNTAGVFDFAWDRSKGEVVYDVRGHKAGDAAGVYAFTKTTTKTRVRTGGFESGVDYTFELRSHGTNEKESPWCDPFVKKAS